MQFENLTAKRKRIWEVDFLRGLAVIFMLFDHLMYDFWYFSVMWRGLYPAGGWFDNMGAFAQEYWGLTLRLVVRIIVIAVFFFTSGVSSSFSKSNFMRGAKLLVVALGMSAVLQVGDNLFGTGVLIYFGVLHCLALSILLYEALKRLRVNRYIIVVLSLAIAIIGGWIYDSGYVAKNDIFMIFGFATNTFWGSSDYFPLLPWAAFLLMGGALGQLLYPKRKTLLPGFESKLTSPVQFIGRHALIFYIGQQVILYGLFTFAGMALGY